jgi:cell division protein FtsB
MKAGVVCFFVIWTMTIGAIAYLALNESKESFERENSALRAELHELKQENLFLEDEFTRVTAIKCMVFDQAKTRSAWLFKRAWSSTSDWIRPRAD